MHRRRTLQILVEFHDSHPRTVTEGIERKGHCMREHGSSAGLGPDGLGLGGRVGGAGKGREET